jgi:hypothetical protein
MHNWRRSCKGTAASETAWYERGQTPNDVGGNEPAGARVSEQRDPLGPSDVDQLLLEIAEQINCDWIESPLVDTAAIATLTIALLLLTGLLTVGCIFCLRAL